MNYGLGGIDFHERDAQPIRYPAFAQLVIDSLDRETGDAPNNFSIYRNQALLYGYFYRLGITEIQFQWDMPTITTGVNDTFQLTDGTTVTTFTIPQGYYNPTTLAAALQTVIQAAGGAFSTFTVAWSDLHNGLTVNGGTTPFAFIPASSQPVNSPLFKNLRNTAQSVGIEPGNCATLAAIQNLGSTKLLYTRYIDFISRNLTKYQRVKDSDTDKTQNKSYIIARLYLTPCNSLVETTATSGVGSRAFYLTVDYASPKWIKYSPDEALSELDIQVLDQYGDQLYWDGTNAVWEFACTILASET
jgi:hypothetical protein